MSNAPTAAIPAPANPLFSVVVCSQNTPEKLAQVNNVGNLWNRGLSDLHTGAIPFLPVVGAPSMGIGYNSVLSNINTEFVIFSHNDAFPAPLDTYFLGRDLKARMKDVDVLGFAGSPRLCGPTWFGSGHCYGQVINLPVPGQPQSVNAALWQRPARLVRGIRVGDGYAVVCRTEAIRKIKWREEFPGFHFYDLCVFADAFEKGLRTAVATDIYIAHQSHGSYNQPEWAAGVPIFEKMWDGKMDMAPMVQHGHGSVTGPDIRFVFRYLREMEKFSNEEVTVR